MMLDQETIRLIDDVNDGDCIEIQYDAGERHRWTIGEFSHLDKDDHGEWCVFLRRRFVGVRLIDTVKIERVKAKAQ